MSFEEVVTWLSESCGKRVGFTLTASSESDTNTSLYVTGTLSETPDHEWLLINPRPGKRIAYGIGENAVFGLLEGDFLEAELLDPVTLLIELQDVAAIVNVRG